MPGGGLTRQVAAKKMMQLEQKEKSMEGKEKQYLAKLVKPMKPSRPGGKNRKYRGAAAKLNPPGFPKRDPVAGRPKRRPM